MPSWKIKKTKTLQSVIRRSRRGEKGTGTIPLIIAISELCDVYSPRDILDVLFLAAINGRAQPYLTFFNLKIALHCWIQHKHMPMISRPQRMASLNDGDEALGLMGDKL